MNRTSIEWTEYTWNPVTGCSPVSPGCANCYARRIYERFHRDFTPKFHPEKLKEARKLPPHSLVFVNSTSDLFHENIAFADINAVFNEIRNRPDVIFQTLTKRPERALEYSNLYMNIPYNAWIGVSVENREYLWRIDVLRQINAVNRFVSFEPLIGPVGKVNLEKIKWVIVGGESGPKHREMNVEWVREIRDQAIAQNIPFFFKQWGGPRPGGQAVLDGREWKEYPKGMILEVKE